MTNWAHLVQSCSRVPSIAEHKGRVVGRFESAEACIDVSLVRETTDVHFRYVLNLCVKARDDFCF